VKAEWGVEPPQVLDVLALTGDASDNVPGVSGIGDKTATKLIARYGSLDGIYGNIAGIEGAVGKKLAAGRESAYFSRSLVELRADAPHGISDIDSLSVESLDRAAGAGVLYRAGVRTVAQALSPEVAKAAEPAAVEAPSNPTGQVGSGATGPVAAEQGALFEAPQTDQYAAAPHPVPTEALRAAGSYRTVTDAAELSRILESGRKKGLIALDFETDGLDAWKAMPFGFSLALQCGEAAYVPIAPHGGAGSPHVDPSTAKALLARVLGVPPSRWSPTTPSTTTRYPGLGHPPVEVPNLGYHDRRMDHRSGAGESIPWIRSSYPGSA
jgi:DNA polymerase-1